MLECDVFIEKVCYSEVSIKYAIGKTTERSGLNVIIYIINIWKAVFFIMLPCFNSKSKSFKMKILSSASCNEMEVQSSHTQLSYLSVNKQIIND